MAYVFLQQAKEHLRITSDESDTDIQLKLDQASGIVLDYLKGQADVAWTEETVPAPVQAATLVMLAHLYRNLGDEMSADEQAWLAVERLLMRMRDPALA